MDASAVQQHYAGIRRVLILILALNWAVALAKIIYGFRTRCASMTADGFHSLSDGSSNIIAIIGIHFACQPEDPGHPYGHKKYETFFSLAIAMLLFILAVGLIHQSFERLGQAITPRVTVESFVIMLLTMGVNIWVMRYEHAKGAALKSDILIADAMHTRADIFVSLSVIITLIVVKLGYPVLDPIATIIIALFIAHAGYEIVKESAVVLCDSAASIDVEELKKIILAVDGVRTCHKIRSRGRPDDIHVDFHVQVDPDMHVNKAHKISYRIEEAVQKSFPGITDVIVHIEPKEKPRR